METAKVVVNNGLELTVAFDYQPAEPATWHCPGTPASIDINEITHVFGMSLDRLDELHDWLLFHSGPDRERFPFGSIEDDIEQELWDALKEREAA